MGGSGGGGGSGAVSWPAYMQDWHEIAIDNAGVDTITTSITDVMNVATGGSPWAGQVPYDPDADITQIVSNPALLQTLVNLLSAGTGLNTLISEIMDHTRIDDAVTEYTADFDARLIADVLPRFRAGMRNINAVVSSAFVLGQANIEANQDRQVAKFSSELHYKTYSDDAFRIIMAKLEFQKVASSMAMDSYKTKIIAKKEETDLEISIDEKDALWDLEVFQYGANFLAGPGGGTVMPGKPSTAQSVMGGAMSGAAAGAMIGGPPGAIIGGVLGAASGFL